MKHEIRTKARQIGYFEAAEKFKELCLKYPLHVSVIKSSTFPSDYKPTGYGLNCFVIDSISSLEPLYFDRYTRQVNIQSKNKKERGVGEGESERVEEE